MTDRTVLVRLRADADQFVREMVKAKASVAAIRDNINTTNDRTAWLTQGVLALGPAVVTTGATAVPVLMGMATQATVAGAAIGGIALAFNGVGDALGALNDYQLNPTTDNLRALQAELARVGADGEAMVRALDRAGEQLSVLQMDARGGMFPGMTEGLDSFLTRLPELRQIITELSRGVGVLASDAGGSLASDEWEPFFDYLANEGQQILVDMGRTMGNFIDGFASMLVAFGPMTEDFSSGLLNMSRGFEDWAEGLTSTSGFYDFVDYIRANGPAVLDMLGALGMALVDIGRAAAPVGEVMVPALEAFAQAVSLIANTPVGPLLVTTAALTSLYGRMVALRGLMGSGAMGQVFGAFGGSVKQAGASVRTATPRMRDLANVMATATYSTRDLVRESKQLPPTMAAYSREAARSRQRISQFARGVAPAVGQVGLLGAAMSGATEEIGLSNTAMLTMMGSLGGPWGAAVGGAVGLMFDLKGATDQAASSQERAAHAMNSNNVEQINEALREQIELRDAMEDRSAITGFGDFFDDLAHGFSSEQFEREFGESWDDSIGRVEGRIGDLENALDKASKRARRQQDWQEAARQIDAFASSASVSFDTLTDALENADVSFDKWLRKVDQQAQAAANQAENIQKAIALGVDPEGLQRLVDEGMAGALRLDQLVQGGPEAIQKFNRVQQRLRRGLGDLDQQAQLLGTILQDALAGKNVDVGPVLAKLNLAKDAFDSLPKNVRSKIRAEGIPQTKRQVDQLVERLDLTEEQRRALVTLKDNGIFGTIQGIISALDNLDGKVATTTVVVNRDIRVGSPFGESANPTHNADGGTVDGPRQPYGDKVLSWLAPGEEVISNRHGEADRYRADRASGRIPQYADGGTVGPGGFPAFANGGRLSASASVGMGIGDIQRLAAAGRLGALDRLNLPVKRLEKALEKSTKELDKERDARRKVRDQMRSLRSDVAGRLRNDPWGGDVDTWSSTHASGSYGAVMSSLQSDITQGREWQQAIRTLRRKGLDDGALEALLQQGDPVAFADLSRRQLADFESTYQRRQAITGSVGGLAARSVYGDDLKDVRQAVNGVRTEVKSLKKAIREENRENRRARRDGAGNAGRRRKR